MDKDDQTSRKRKKKKLQNQLEKYHVIKGPRLPKSNNSETENRKCFKIDRDLLLLMLNVILFNFIQIGQSKLGVIVQIGNADGRTGGQTESTY